MSCNCRLCGKHISELTGSYLTRVNPKGEIGIWECRPSCDSLLPQDELLLIALDCDNEVIENAD